MGFLRHPSAWTHGKDKAVSKVRGMKFLLGGGKNKEREKPYKTNHVHKKSRKCQIGGAGVGGGNGQWRREPRS